MECGRRCCIPGCTPAAGWRPWRRRWWSASRARPCWLACSTRAGGRGGRGAGEHRGKLGGAGRDRGPGGVGGGAADSLRPPTAPPGLPDWTQTCRKTSFTEDARATAHLCCSTWRIFARVLLLVKTAAAKMVPTMMTTTPRVTLELAERTVCAAAARSFSLEAENIEIIEVSLS